MRIAGLGSAVAVVIAVVVATAGCGGGQAATGGGVGAESTEARGAKEHGAMPETIGRVEKTPAEWRKILTPEQYRITVEKGTEAPGSSPVSSIKDGGVFECVRCGLALFSSEAKYESCTGWPSFWAPIEASHIKTETDRTLFMERTEVMCARCDSHIGHVFEDGPPPTGLRYCTNGTALRFVPKGAAAAR